MNKVLAIAPYPYLPFHSGGQKFIAKFFEYLGIEIDLTVISSKSNELGLAKNYKLNPLLKKSFSRYYDRSLIGKISQIVKNDGFDTLILEHPYLAWLAFAIRKRTGIKVFIHTHNIEYQRFKSTGKWWWPILKWYEKKSFKKADGLFFITPEDRQFAISKWNISSDKCFDLPYGIENSNYPANKEHCRDVISLKHNINSEEKILLFAGALNYKPNLDAVKIILEKINPLLIQKESFKYKIIICGKGLPEEMNSLSTYTEMNIIYAGFVDDISTYYKGADLFLNPVLSGGGVKTKIVEAIAFGTTVISTETGAEGIVKDVCGEKLQIVNNEDWEKFVHILMDLKTSDNQTPQEYYNYYFYPNIIKRISNIV